MKPACLLISLMLISFHAFSQQIIEQYSAQADSLQIGPRSYLPYNPKGYTLFLPNNSSEIRGVLISLEDQPFATTDSAAFVHPEALAKGFGVLYLSSGVPLDLYFSNSSLQMIDSSLQQIFSRHRLPKNNIFFL